MSAGRIRLVTKGDDLGTTHAGNLAFAEAFRRGILRNASVVACGPFAWEAAQMLAGEKQLCFGLHSCLTAEWDRVRWGPVLPARQVPSLVQPDGTFFQTTGALFQNAPRLEEMLAELQAQLDRARRLGFDIRYLDVHMGWGWVFRHLYGTDPLNRWLEREGLAARLAYDHLPTPTPHSDPVEQLIAQLEAANPGQYVIVGQPGYDNAEMRALGYRNYPGERVARDRDAHRRLFTDPRLIEYCAARDIALLRHDQADHLPAQTLPSYKLPD